MKQRTPALMIQGTSSDAGKSLLAAALCRILTQDGFNVAPFKSQNMALNSCVTADGLEMGRAQAVQAAACRRQPDVRMNPILLKPTSDLGSQVIVMGKPMGLMRVREYWNYKPTAFARACEAYDSLAAACDVMVLEGAGSPAEINLRQHDIVNMTMAAYAGAPVLLAGDIDRGGVFASLVGTLSLMDAADKRLVAGLVVNKFRGDASLLPPALEKVSALTGKPFLGVVPWLDNLDLPEEDSVSFKAGTGCATDGGEKDLDVAVIDLPRISNFTDLNALSVEPDTQVRVVRRAADLGAPDVVIIPGSRNTAGDLRWLRDQGLAASLETLRASGRPPIMLGICGGLQMLGRMVHDPEGLEDGGSMPGLGWLDLETALAPDKTLVRTAATCLDGSVSLEGYEIHHGRTLAAGSQLVPWITAQDGAPVGWRDRGGQVFGTYLHGLFDADGFRRHFLNRVRERKGFAPLAGLTPYSLEPALERLAETVRASLDMRAIYGLLGLPFRK